MDVTPLSISQLSGGATKNLWSGVQAKSKGLESESALRDVAHGGTNLQEQINQILRHIRRLVAFISGISSSAPSLIQEVTLTSPTTLITTTVTPAAGDRLVIVITIDGTAGRQITWDAIFKGVSVNDIDNEVNLINIYSFIGRADSKWWKCSPTMLGLTA